MTEQPKTPTGKISIAFVNSIFLRRDAISNTLHDRVQFAAAHRDLFDYKVFCYASDYPTLNVEIVRNAGDIIQSPDFRNADIVVVEFGIYHDLFDVVLCETRAAKLVSYHNVTSSWLFEPGDKRQLCERSEAQGWNLAFADFVVCNSRFTLEQAKAYGVDLSRTRVIAPSVPATGGWRVEKDPDGPVVLLCVGRLVAQKGILDLVKALEILSHVELPAWRLHVVGAMKFSDPAYVRLLRREIEDAGLQDCVHFLGELDETEIRRAFAQAHVLAAPSHHEGFGVPVIEGLASGCVVVCSDAGALPEVAGEFGNIYPCGDRRALAKLLIRVLSDLRPRQGEAKYRVGARVLSEAEYYAAAEAYVAPFLPKTAVAEFYGVVRDLVAQKRGAEIADPPEHPGQSVLGLTGDLAACR
ncbi:glycosyltransferase family 4 protein [uncultured Rhodoblastus sp.]|uniref:glycosyltransferase family 4 protein n=1 Tax=uncultured Rhodoblastus sp. TaxID=543037 RepID=UPI0025E928F4|nr:glycosyltransferase family 4 protein [uncultured Rhodoblastus sp.]